MSDKIGVFNMALGHLRAGSIIDENEDSNEADTLRTYWDTARKVTLERFNWGFARRRKALSQLVEITGLLPGYRYQYPTDCLKMRAVVSAGEVDPFVMSRLPSYGRRPTPFEIEYTAENGKTILTPLEGAHGVYTFDLKNIELWAEDGALALSYMLAHLSAMKINGSQDDVKRCLQLFASSFDISTQNDANEGAYFEEDESEFERSRY